MPDDIENIKSELNEIKNNLASIKEQTTQARNNTKATKDETDKNAKSIRSEINNELGKVRSLLNKNVQNALQGLIVERKSFKQVLGNFSQNFFQGLIQRSLNTNPFARITPFAQGGVINSPTYFPLGGGAGLAGERGAEAILPLARGADGSLGVRAAGGARPIQINIQTPNPSSFQQSQTQIALALRRAVARGARNS